MFHLSVCGQEQHSRQKRWTLTAVCVVLNKSTRGQKRTTLSLILVANRHGSWKVALITSSSTEREDGWHPGGWVGLGVEGVGKPGSIRRYFIFKRNFNQTFPSDCCWQTTLRLKILSFSRHSMCTNGRTFTYLK